MVCDGAGTPAARPGGVRCSLICAAASCRHYLYSAGVGDLSTTRASPAAPTSHTCCCRFTHSPPTRQTTVLSLIGHRNSMIYSSCE
ncbi:hypothetical protein JYU34_016223 [Plutella xylostella]|uniref:Uncharacterized protein n=1 Tax=Plutella xylostella TaxID=51655 RepID=A0ABQ7Q5W1_PLUXY|nr:hypothetical protein JYU34_016223 [Plutella xylostella]